MTALDPDAPALLLDRPDTGLVDALAASPNHGERSGSGVPDAIILHYTGMADGASAIAWLRNPAAQVSCHYVVDEAGSILQLVAERRRAWHAGRSTWHGETDMNSRSVGIEIVNAGHPGGLPDYPEEQIAAVVALCRDIARRHDVRPERILAHSDIAPGRKQDPGERFPWDRLAAAGVGLWVPPPAGWTGPTLARGDAGPAVTELQAALYSYGYGIEPTGQFDAETEKVVRAFQLHFRPARVDGIADAETCATLDALLAALKRSAQLRSAS